MLCVLIRIMKVCCMFSLAFPHQGDSNENTQGTFMLGKLRDIPIMPPVLVL